MHPDPVISRRWYGSKILLFGGSAGSFKLLIESVKVLRPGLDKAVVIVMHRAKNYESEFTQMLGRDCALPVREIADKDPVERGVVYVAPANYHTLFEIDNSFALDVSDSAWFTKPAIDVTFESAADRYGDECTAVLLSGANPDGAFGMLKLRQAGSLTIAQDPAEAEMSEMPQAAIDLGAAELILNTHELLAMLST